ncbi:uncharacterized protein ACIB01_014664 [Guaruba guarouba]
MPGALQPGGATEQAQHRSRNRKFLALSTLSPSSATASRRDLGDSASRLGEGLPPHLPRLVRYGLNRRRSRQLRLTHPKRKPRRGINPSGPPAPTARTLPAAPARPRSEAALLTAPAGRKTHRWPGAAGDLRGGKPVTSAPRGQPESWGAALRSPPRGRAAPAAAVAFPARGRLPPALPRAAGQCGPRRGAGFNHLLRGASSQRCRLPRRGAPAQAPRRGGGEPGGSFTPTRGAVCPLYPEELGLFPPPHPHLPQDRRASGLALRASALSSPHPLLFRCSAPAAPPGPPWGEGRAALLGVPRRALGTAPGSPALGAPGAKYLHKKMLFILVLHTSSYIEVKEWLEIQQSTGEQLASVTVKIQVTHLYKKSSQNPKACAGADTTKEKPWMDGCC